MDAGSNWPDHTERYERRRPPTHAFWLGAAGAALLAYVLLGEGLEGASTSNDWVVDLLVIGAALVLLVAAVLSMARPYVPVLLFLTAAAVSVALLGVSVVVECANPGHLIPDPEMLQAVEQYQDEARIDAVPPRRGDSSPSAHVEPQEALITVPTPVKVVLAKEALKDYPNDKQLAPDLCKPARVDYALAVGGTWGAPTLRFFASGEPLPQDLAHSPVRTPACADHPYSWDWTAPPGAVTVWPDS